MAPLIKTREIKVSHYILKGTVTATAPEPKYEGDFSDEAKETYLDFDENEPVLGNGKW